MQDRVAEDEGCILRLGAGVFAGTEEEKESHDDDILGRLNAGVVGCLYDSYGVVEYMDGDGFHLLERSIQLGVGTVLGP